MPINGGGGSSRKKSAESNKGPIKTIFIGNIIVDAVFFQAIGDAVSRKESGCLGKPRGPVDPKKVVAIKRKINPEIWKRITNFVLAIIICSVHRLQHNFVKVSYRKAAPRLGLASRCCHNAKPTVALRSLRPAVRVRISRYLSKIKPPNGGSNLAC